MTAFTKALYYPWQDIHDVAWLRTACLYWDEIATIVSHGDSSPYNSPETRALHDIGILVPIYNFHDDAWRAAGLMRELAETGEWKGVLTKNERGQAAHLLETREEWITNPHWDLMYGAFKKDRLLDWRHLKGNIAHLYLTILAGNVARSTGRALITDKPGMRLLAESVRIGRPLPGAVSLEGGRALSTPQIVGEADPPRSMQVAVIEVAVNAIHIDPTVPITRLIDFREGHFAQLLCLRNEVDRLARELRDDLVNGEYASTPEAVQQAIRDKCTGIEAALSDLERQLRAQRIQSRREWLEIALLATVPSAVVAPMLGLMSLTAGAAAAAIRITFAMRKAAVQKSNIIDGDPYSYLLLARQSFTPTDQMR